MKNDLIIIKLFLSLFLFGLLMTGCVEKNRFADSGAIRYQKVQILNPEIWTSFQDEKTELIGYKDSNQNIKIQPKFIFTIAKQFKNIIAVYEYIDEKTHKSYYLLKNGEKVGRNSLYMWDNAPDCEHEEKIRFRDKTTDKVGFFDKNGHKIIPALYSDALPFRNNMAVVLENAERVCWGGEKYSDKKKCEHWSWKGGQTHLINENNEILIENFQHERNLDWFSLKITETKGDELIRDSFKGTNGEYYSFINFEKEFKHWFESNFLISTNINALRDNCFSEITYWSNKKSGWIKKDANDFLAKNKKVLLQQMNDFRQGTLSYSIQRYPLDPFIWRSAQNKQYFDLCGSYKHWLHPVFDVVVSYRNKKGILELDTKNHFLFFKADDGYKLISLGLKGKEL